MKSELKIRRAVETLWEQYGALADDATADEPPSREMEITQSLIGFGEWALGFDTAASMAFRVLLDGHRENVRRFLNTN